MHRSVTTSLFLCCMLTGCDSPKSSLGELPDASSGAAESTETSEITATTADGVPTGQDVGAPCEASFVPEARLLELDNPDCGSGMCLYANSTVASPNQTCNDSSECDGVEHGVICNGGVCQLDPAYIAATTMCTDTCVEDADCVGVEGTACTQGFACVPVAAVGEACCQPVCVCLDDFERDDVESLAMQCEAGTAACCEIEEPTPAACGGA